MTALLMSPPPIPPGPTGGLSALTRRQLECLHLLAEGYGYREIAQRMDISYHGVNMLIRRSYAALGVTGQGRIAAFRVLGWLD